jgi:hypothetical protein
MEDYLDSRGQGYVYQELCKAHSHLWANARSLENREAELGCRLADLEQEYRNASHTCPECSGEMIDMGLDFKPPKQTDAKAWKTLQGMYRVGHAFHTCGCDGPGWIPSSTNDYRNYLASKKKGYEEQLLLVRKSSTLSSVEKAEAGEFWSSRIEAVEWEQRNLA